MWCAWSGVPGRNPSLFVYFQLSKIEKHESYDARNNFLSDIALMQLGEPARMSENVNVACVFRDSTGDPLPGDEGEVCYDSLCMQFAHANCIIP